jgi:flagellar biosynthesis anti-sigma factor FlgM
MKIENSGIQPLSTNRPEATRRAEKKDNVKNVSATRGGTDKAEMSENARLLAKARAALGNVSDSDSERLAALKQQIESGDYTVQVGDLARKLAAKFYQK